MTTPAMVETLQLAKEIHAELERLRKIESRYEELYNAVAAQLDEEMDAAGGDGDEVTMAALERINEAAWAAFRGRHQEATKGKAS